MAAASPLRRATAPPRRRLARSAVAAFALTVTALSVTAHSAAAAGTNGLAATAALGDSLGVNGGGGERR